MNLNKRRILMNAFFLYQFHYPNKFPLFRVIKNTKVYSGKNLFWHKVQKVQKQKCKINILRLFTLFLFISFSASKIIMKKSRRIRPLSSFGNLCKWHYQFKSYTIWFSSCTMWLKHNDIYISRMHELFQTMYQGIFWHWIMHFFLCNKILFYTYI